LWWGRSSAERTRSNVGPRIHRSPNNAPGWSDRGEIYRHALWFEASVPSENHRKFFSAIGSLNAPPSVPVRYLQRSDGRRGPPCPPRSPILESRRMDRAAGCANRRRNAQLRRRGGHDLAIRVYHANELCLPHLDAAPVSVKDSEEDLLPPDVILQSPPRVVLGWSRFVANGPFLRRMGQQLEQLILNLVRNSI
jgi:hypothetical protein